MRQSIAPGVAVGTGRVKPSFTALDSHGVFLSTLIQIVLPRLTVTLVPVAHS